MSENSSDSDSSCGWTVLNHEGSDVEALSSEHGPGSGGSELAPDASSLEQGLQLGQDEASQRDVAPRGDVARPSAEETKPASEGEEAKSLDDNVYFGAVSDDSDIVTLEPPKLAETGGPEEAPSAKEAQSLEDFNLGSSSSSQYTFCQPETVFSSQPSDDESSSDEASHQPSPAFKRRRAKKKPMSTSDSEDHPLAEQEPEPPKEQCKRPFSSGLNKCVILALVIAVSMGFGHFYGTIQSQKDQLLVRKVYEDDLIDIKDYLSQCQQGQESFIGYESQKGNLARCRTLSEREKVPPGTQQKDLRTGNQHLGRPGAQEEAALASLQEELRKLRAQIGALEETGTSPKLATENRQLRQQLAEETLRTRSFLSQREALRAEAKTLRRQVERERQLSTALRGELRQLGRRPGPLAEEEEAEAEMEEEAETEKEEAETLRGRLAEKKAEAEMEKAEAEMEEEEEMEKEEAETEKAEAETEKAEALRGRLAEKAEALRGRLAEKAETLRGRLAEKAETLRGRLAEKAETLRLAEQKAEAETGKAEAEALRARLAELERKLGFAQQRADLWERLYVEARGQAGAPGRAGEKTRGRGDPAARTPPRGSLLGSVKETFAAMKNSTQEFVRHHKAKIKRAKEAVKENLRKFTDSVRSTFRRFRDTARNFEEKGGRCGGPDAAAGAKQRPAPTARAQTPCGGPERGGAPAFEEFLKRAHAPPKCRAQRACGEAPRPAPKACSGAARCAPLHAEPPSPVRFEEFRELVQRYLLRELRGFHHWQELDQFIAAFFLDGVFVHDRKLFTDFVGDVKAYLQDMDEYRGHGGGALDKLDGYIYGHFFGRPLSPPYGPSRPDRKQRLVNIDSSRHRKQEQKRPQTQPQKREGKWYKYGRTDGRYMANLEIELGQLPFDPKY